MSNHKRQWIEKGELFPCPNKPHYFKFRESLGYWQWASDCWSDISSRGDMENQLLFAGTVSTLSGFKFFKIVIWKLYVIFGVKP